MLPKVTRRLFDLSCGRKQDASVGRLALERRITSGMRGAGRQAVDRHSSSFPCSCHLRPLPPPFFLPEGDLDLGFFALPFEPVGLCDLRCSNLQLLPFLQVPRA